jgi:ATP synthase protein I
MAAGDQRSRRVKPALFGIYTRLLLILSTVAIAIAGYRYDVGLSFLLGGILHLLPNIYFARQLYRYSGAVDVQRIAQSVYRGEVGKFLMTGAGFAVVFGLIDTVVPAALFGGFGLMLVCHTFAVATISR